MATRSTSSAHCRVTKWQPAPVLVHAAMLLPWPCGGVCTFVLCVIPRCCVAPLANATPRMCVPISAYVCLYIVSVCMSVSVCARLRLVGALFLGSGRTASAQWHRGSVLYTPAAGDWVVDGSGLASCHHACPPCPTMYAGCKTWHCLACRITSPHAALQCKPLQTQPVWCMFKVRLSVP